MLYLFGFLFIFVCGGLTGVMLALVPFNWQAHDSYFVVAHLHYVLIGGFVFPLLAAAHYWLPLMSGKAPSESLGKWAFWLIFIGFNATFLHMHITGLAGMPRRIYTYGEGMGWEWLNLASSIGGFVLTIGFAAFFLDLIVRLRAGHDSPRNPWQAGTLEWSLAHPPAPYNFASLPEIDSREPLWDQDGLIDQIERGDGYLAEVRNGWQETLGVDAVTGKPDQIIILPGPSYLPLITASLLGVFFVGFLFGLYWLSALGAAAALGAALRWAWATGLDRDWPDQDAGRGLTLPLHPQVHDAPGWWGMVGGLLVDATFYITLLFGYLYLWAVAPDWPPPTFIDSHLPLTLATVFSALVAALANHWAVRSNASGASPTGALVVTTVAGLIAAAGCLAQILFGLPAPTSHAYVAVTTFLLGFCALHLGLTGIFAAFVLLRFRHGFVSPRRSLDLRVIRLWTGYSALISLIALALIHGLPGLLGAIS